MSNKDLIEHDFMDFGYHRDFYNTDIYRHCDQFFQKRMRDHTIINVYYYDLFTDEGALDYGYEFERIDESNDKYVVRTIVSNIDKSMTVDDVERVLYNEK